MSDDLRDAPRRPRLRGQPLEGEPTTLIVTRQGAGQAGHVWLIDTGTITTTVVLTSQEAKQLAGMLSDASSYLVHSVNGTARKLPGRRDDRPRFEDHHPEIAGWPPVAAH